jgi:hypothetical protein
MMTLYDRWSSKITLPYSVCHGVCLDPRSLEAGAADIGLDSAIPPSFFELWRGELACCTTNH